jgi:hypothetical protein
MAASVQFCWPSAFRNLAVCVQDLVAADRPLIVHDPDVAGSDDCLAFGAVDMPIKPGEYTYSRPGIPDSGYTLFGDLLRPQGRVER